MKWTTGLWPYPIAAGYAIVSLVASGHAVLNKRDTRAAIGWVGAIWLAPILGTLLYVWLGINRIERRARELRTKRPLTGPNTGVGAYPVEVLDQVLTPEGTHLKSLVRLVGDVTRRGLVRAIASRRSSTATRPTRRCFWRSTKPRDPSR